MQKSRNVFIARSFSDVLYHRKSVSGIQILGGATATKEIAENCLTIRSIPELCFIDKRERYIDCGPGATVYDLLALGENKMPKVLYEALSSIGTEGIRNLATIGGNICATGFYHSLYAPLLALNARLEFRSQNEIKSVPFSKFKGVPQNFILSKIRIPFDEWNLEFFKRVGPDAIISPLTASYVFLAELQKGIISNIRIVFAGKILFNSVELEDKIIGTRLPLSPKTVEMLIEEAEKIYLEDESRKNAEPILKAQFLNLLRNSFERLS